MVSFLHPLVVIMSNFCPIQVFTFNVLTLEKRNYKLGLIVLKFQV